MYGHQKQGIMTLEEAQKEVDRWIKTYGVRYFSELTNMAVLTEEVGELARVGPYLSGQPDRSKPDRSLPSKLGEENK